MQSQENEAVGENDDYKRSKLRESEDLICATVCVHVLVQKQSVCLDEN